MEYVKFFSILFGSLGTILALGWKGLDVFKKIRVEVALGVEEKRVFAEKIQTDFKTLMDRANNDLLRVEGKLEEMEEQWKEFKGENRDFKRDMKDVLAQWGEGLKDSQAFVEMIVKQNKNI